MKIVFLLFFIIFLYNISFAYMIPIELDKERKSLINIHLDPYYTGIDFTRSLTDKPIPKTVMTNEFAFYLHLLKNIYLPRYFLIEASIYPLPLVGVYTRKYANDFYNDTDVTFKGFNVNFVKAITTGFPEPWAASLFFGNVNDFVSDNGEDVVGKGYGGLLFSAGNRHIVDNIMVNDNWFETEIKLKGTDIRESHDLSWSYAVGAKFHDNVDIKNTLYLSIKRNRIDFVKHKGRPILNFFLYNSEQEVQIDFNMRQFYLGKLSRVSFLFGKSFTVFDNNVAFSFGVGTLKIFEDGYSGHLQSQISNKWSLIFRPNVKLTF